MSEIKDGSKVTLEYKGTLDDGSVFDTSEGKEPLVFAVGQKQVIKGFNDAVVGMKEGEEKDFSLNPEEAYGNFNEQLVQEVPKEKFPDILEPKVGMMLTLNAPDDKKYHARVSEIKEKTFTVDLNHPLAGKKLNFHIKIVKVE